MLIEIHLSHKNRFIISFSIDFLYLCLIDFWLLKISYYYFCANTLGDTWNIRTVEKLSVHLVDLCRLNRNKNCGSTCQTLAGSRTNPQPAIICLVNGQNTVLVAFFSEFCLNLKTSAGLRQNTDIVWVCVTKPADLYRLTDNLDVLSQPADV